MFTGLIADVGELIARSSKQFTLRTTYPLKPEETGLSICCDGVCLTATAIRPIPTGAEFTVDVSNETMAKSTLNGWKPGPRVNLERSLRAGDELGGHIVSGHVDGIAKIVAITPDGDSKRFLLEAPEHLSRYIVPKGSVALDGTSLTVNEVVRSRFGVNLIPHSLTMTTWGAKTPGDLVNLEVDIFARYAARLNGVSSLMSGPSNLQAASSGSELSSIEEIVEEMQNGRMVILVDAEDRENEGDLIIPAQMATPDAINFMTKYGRGLVCLSLTQTRAAELSLNYMVRHNSSRNRTAFTASIEAREGISTGISAFDRARTIATAIDPTKDANDIVSPGHVFPLIASEGGVLVRAGHTEASIDLAKLAGLNPSAVICEVMNEDGTMARMANLVCFAKVHGLKIGAIEDLIVYRLKNDRVVKRVAQAPVTTLAGDFNLYAYDTTVEPGEHLALVKGELSKDGPVLACVHAVNVLSDVVGIDDRHSEGGSTVIEQAMRAVEADGRGVIVLVCDLRQKSVTEWVSRRATLGVVANSSKERRQVEIGIGLQILADLGVKDMVLLATPPQSTYVGLVKAFGLRVTGIRKIG